MTTAASQTTPKPPSAKVRRLSWHCMFEDCGANFSTTTRRGLKVTCPKCKRVQPGPEAIRRRLAELEEKASKNGAERSRRPPSARTLPEEPPARQRVKARVVGAKPKPEPVAVEAVTVAAVADPAAAPPLPTEQPKRRSLFDRVMGYER